MMGTARGVVVCFALAILLPAAAWAAGHARVDANLLWYAAGETTPTCDLKNDACPCRFDALVTALSHTWGQPVGRGGPVTAGKLTALFRAQQTQGRVKQAVALRSDANLVVSFAHLETQKQLTIFGKDGCATQTVNWTPVGLVVLNIKQFALLSAVPRTPAPPARAPPSHLNTAPAPAPAPH